MTTAAPQQVNGSHGVNRALTHYARAKGYRRAERRLLGPDVDPEYCLTDFLFKIGIGDGDALRKVYGAERTKAPMGQASGPSGGYLVPSILQQDLMQDAAEEALVRPRATVVGMTSSEMLLPLPLATTARTAGTSPMFGGILMQWTQEGQTRPETAEADWAQLKLHAWDLTGYALQSNPLFQDGGGGLESYLRQLFGRSIGWYEDFAYLRGDGVGKPLGMVNAPGTKVITRSGSGAFAAADVAAMSTALLPASWARAIWVVSVSLWNKLIVLGSTQWQMNMQFEPEEGGRPAFVLNGQPGFVSEKLPGIGTQGDVILFDPQLYVIGDRGAVEIAVSDHEPTAFTKNQRVWRVTYRGDGSPWFAKTITLADGSTTVSPYVVLSTL